METKKFIATMSFFVAFVAALVGSDKSCWGIFILTGVFYMVIGWLASIGVLFTWDLIAPKNFESMKEKVSHIFDVFAGITNS